MTIVMYLWCFLAVELGQALQVALKMKSISDKAKLSSLEFSTNSYFKDDKWGLIAGLISNLAFLMFVDELVKIKPEIVDYLKFGFFFVGYTGSDIILRFMSVANKKINAGIDIKTTKADEQSS